MGYITHTFTKDHLQVLLPETFNSGGEARGGVVALM